MRIAILGASGFVGKHLHDALIARGDTVQSVSLRDPEAAAHAVADDDVVVNLAGEPIAQRWNHAVKERIAQSRVQAPRAFIDALARQESRPSAYISASAIGYYGPSETATFTEQSPAGKDFLARVCEGWEQEAERAKALGLRVACIRTGLALAGDGGALGKMLPLFRLGLGGKLGSGRQWFSWIHITDLIGIYLLAINGAQDAINATAPQPVTNAAFTQALSAVLHRRTPFPVPAAALRLMLGEGADVLLYGQRVLPQRAESLGYAFHYPNLEAALADLLNAPLAG
ncbi:MAG: TIGR01777 family oxidoreductase [Vulcanimicrobiaceae bacterium]